MSITAVPGALIVKFFLLAGALALGLLASCATPAEPLDDASFDIADLNNAGLAALRSVGRGVWGMAIAP